MNKKISELPMLDRLPEEDEILLPVCKYNSYGRMFVTSQISIDQLAAAIVKKGCVSMELTRDGVVVFKAM